MEAPVNGPGRLQGKDSPDLMAICTKKMTLAFKGIDRDFSVFILPVMRLKRGKRRQVVICDCKANAQLDILI